MSKDEFAKDVSRITEERGKVYGHPSVDFGRAMRIKAVIAECKDPLARHALEMIAVKIARLIESPDHVDSWDDVAGYAWCGKEVTRKAPAPVSYAGLQGLADRAAKIPKY
jgi:hypothetical protein